MNRIYPPLLITAAVIALVNKWPQQAWVWLWLNTNFNQFSNVTSLQPAQLASGAPLGVPSSSVNGVTQLQTPTSSGFSVPPGSISVGGTSVGSSSGMFGLQVP